MSHNFFFRNLYTIDFFGQNINFLYKGSPTIKTVFGGIVSTVITMLGLLLFGYFSIDLFERKNPISRISQELRNISEIKLTDFPIAIGFVNPAGEPFGEEIYSLVTIHPLMFSFSNIDGATVTTVRRAFVEKCNPDVHFANYKEIFKDQYASLGNELCINPFKAGIEHPSIPLNTYVENKSGNYSGYLSFYNEFGAVPSAFFDLILKRCNEERDQKKCADDETFKSLTKELYIVVKTIDYFVDLQDLYEPNKKKLVSYAQMIGYDQPKRSFHKYKKVWVNTDDGFLMENSNNLEFYQFSNNKLDFFQSDDHFFEMTLEVDTVQDIFFRRYDKIQDVLARVGGMFKLISLIGQFVIHYYSKYVFYFDITDKFFEKVNKDKTIFPENNTFHVNLRNMNKNMTQVGNNTSLVDNYLIRNFQTREILNLNFSDYLKSKICSKRSKYSPSIYLLSTAILKNYLDILTYLKKLRNVDQLIHIITNSEEEKNIFNYKQDLEKFCMENLEFTTQKENYDEIILQMKRRKE